MTKKILIVSSVPTHPSYAGNRSCILSYSKILSDLGFEVYFLWVKGFDNTEEDMQKTRKYWGNKLFIYEKSSIQRVIEAFYRHVYFKIYKEHPLDCYYPNGLTIFIKELHNTFNFYGIIVNYIFLSKLFTKIQNTKKLLFTHDLFSNRFALTGNSWFSVSSRKEAKAINRSDIILAIQDDEAKFYKKLTNKKVLTVFSYFETHVTPYVKNNNLLYLAGSNIHNLKSIHNFINGPFQKILNQDQSIRLIIGGKICDELKFLKKENVILYGKVNNLLDFYSKGNIFINPTEEGTGLKIKTFEAMSYGKVLVSHPHNTKGIFRLESAPIFTIKDIDDYIDTILSLINNKEQIIDKKVESINYINELNSWVYDQYKIALWD